MHAQRNIPATLGGRGQARMPTVPPLQLAAHLGCQAAHEGWNRPVVHQQQRRQPSALERTLALLE
jgi:hypothetical protein